MPFDPESRSVPASLYGSPECESTTLYHVFESEQESTRRLAFAEIVRVGGRYAMQVIQDN